MTNAEDRESTLRVDGNNDGVNLPFICWLVMIETLLCSDRVCMDNPRLVHQAITDLSALVGNSSPTHPIK